MIFLILFIHLYVVKKKDNKKKINNNKDKWFYDIHSWRNYSYNLEYKNLFKKS